jgi:hypothetical protein
MWLVKLSGRLDHCVEEAELQWRRRTLMAVSATWNICDDLNMERMDTEIKALTTGQKQNEIPSAVLLGTNESIMAFATSNAQLSENLQSLNN